MRGALAVGLALAGSVVFSGAAAAQGVPSDGRYTGGEVRDLAPTSGFPGRTGDSLVSLRIADGGLAVQAAAVVLHRCGKAQGVEARGGDVGPIDLSTGAFVVRTKRDVGGGIVDRLTVRGRIEGDRATGTVESSTTERGRRVCRGTARWTALRRPPTLATVPVRPPAAALMVGGYEVAGSLPYQLALRISGDGLRVRRLNLHTALKCRRGTDEAAYFRRGATIGADGTFRYDTTYSERYSDGTERGRIVVTGRFVQGGVTGTIDAAYTFRNRRGRLTDRCRSGRRTFWAAVT